tara:strand:+ start:1712 stop:2380 length:669 start_codon:yes stop_codon:yes gene_type:complete
MDFKKKYLKYKIKYINLKNQSGGENFKNDNRILDDIQINQIIEGEQEWEQTVYSSRSFNRTGELQISELFSLLNMSPPVFRILLNRTSYTNNVSLKPLDVLIYKNTLDTLFKKMNHTISEDIQLSSYHMNVDTGFSSPYSVRQVDSFLRKIGIDTTHLLTDINCIKKTRDECIKSIKDCRWQPVNTYNENDETCYRVDYNQKSRKPKIKQHSLEHLPIINEE